MVMALNVSHVLFKTWPQLRDAVLPQGCDLLELGITESAVIRAVGPPRIKIVSIPDECSRPMGQPCMKSETDRVSIDTHVVRDSRSAYHVVLLAPAE